MWEVAKRVRWFFGGMEETGSLGHLTRLEDVKESYHVEHLTIMRMRGSKDATIS